MEKFNEAQEKLDDLNERKENQIEIHLLKEEVKS